MLLILVVVKWYLIMVLMLISLVIVILNILSCAYWRFVYLLGRNIYSSSWPMLFDVFYYL